MSEPCTPAWSSFVGPSRIFVDILLTRSSPRGANSLILVVILLLEQRWEVDSAVRSWQRVSESCSNWRTLPKSWCPGGESNPHEEKSPEDFKSSASAIPPPGHRWKWRESVYGIRVSSTTCEPPWARTRRLLEWVPGCALKPVSCS